MTVAGRRLLILGASGRTGRHLVAQAAQRGATVTALVRDPARLPPELASCARVVQADVGDGEAVARAMVEQDVVISALGVSRPLHRDPVVVRGIGNVVAALQSKGPRRLVYLSATAVWPSRADASLLVRFFASTVIRQEIRDHEAKEALVRGSGLDWTILRAPLLTDSAPHGNWRVGAHLPSRGLLPRLPRADVAAALLDVADDDGAARQELRVLPA